MFVRFLPIYLEYVWHSDSFLGYYFFSQVHKGCEQNHLLEDYDWPKLTSESFYTFLLTSETRFHVAPYDLALTLYCGEPQVPDHAANTSLVLGLLKCATMSSFVVCFGGLCKRTLFNFKSYY